MIFRGLRKVVFFCIGLPTTIACLIYLMAFAVVGDDISDQLSIIILLLASLRCLFKGRVDSLNFSITIAQFYLFVVPCISLAAFGYYKLVFILALAVVLCDLFILLTGKQEITIQSTTPSWVRLTQWDHLLWWGLIAFLFLAGSILPDGGQLTRQLSFNVPYALSLVIFERFCRLAPMQVIYRMLVVYLLAVGFYVVFYWSGFGRIVIGSYILLPLLLAHQWRDIGLRVWQGIVIAPMAILVANISRHGDNASFAELHQGSIAAHMVLTRQLYDQMSYTQPIGWGGYWDQWLLLFLQWFPRAIWPDKPIGAGREYVEQTGLIYVTAEGHSVALGYMGEVLYYLGDEAAWGGIITFISLLLVRRFVRRAAGVYTAPVLAYDVFLISFLWGGVSLFGGRMSFIVLPMLAFIFLRRLKIRRNPSIIRA